MPEIQVVKVKDLADKTSAINGLMKLNPLHPMVVHVDDHVTNQKAAEAPFYRDADDKAIFECRAYGHPWMRVGTKLSNKIWPPTKDLTAVANDCEVYYPNFDYIADGFDGYDNGDVPPPPGP